MKVLALLKPLIDVIKHLPSPPASSLVSFAKAAADLQPCLLMGTPAQAFPLVKDLLCLTLKSLACLGNISPADRPAIAVGIQSVLDLAGYFFVIAGVAPIRLGVVDDPSALAADIKALEAVAATLGGCVA